MPLQKGRVAVRRLRMGLIEGLKPSAALPVAGWSTLPAEAQQELVSCPCGRGIQDPEHIVAYCEYTDGIRADVAAHIEEVVKAQGSDQDKAKLASINQQQRAIHTLQSIPRFSAATERSIRGPAAKLWREGVESLSCRLKAENEGIAAETTACVAQAAISG